MPRKLPPEMLDMQRQIEAYARAAGLDMFDCYYEMLDFDEINMVASYMGFPVRYPHWKWGMEYERMSRSYEYGLHKIYEMVINNDPCYAYLLESNAMTDQKMVMCHVCGHNDFFKNNFTFQHTNRKMIDEMANHATRIRRYIDWYGVEVVETFVDRCLSIDNLIDFNSPYIKRKRKEEDRGTTQPPDKKRDLGLLPTSREYMERYINPDDFVAAQKKRLEDEAKKQKRFPVEPERDVMGFLMSHAPLEPWQVDVLDMLREEAYYFAPQGMTKIMNEGWASYWHAKLMTEKAMDSSEVIDFADKHSGVTATSPQNINPYKLGLELYRDIEDRWNKGRFGKEWNECDDMAERRRWDKQLGLGRDKIFQVRQIYSDVTFIDEFFTIDFCREHGFFSYEYDRKRKQWIIDSRDFDTIKTKILQQLTNFGHPVIRVIDGNYENRAELLLEHTHDGVDLDAGYAQDTLRNLHAIWSRSVHILTAQDQRRLMLSFDGSGFHERSV
ncbi:MAG: SpoVR family protein [Deltaproteobacteria bacterium RBG_16_71_12]|nr:MAG: SpoVR family protein [Deltaproteobacteria bacterium RBG_16_71_12]